MSDIFTTAILAAAKELHIDYAWIFDGDNGAPTEENEFVEVMRSHLSPLIDGSWREARIAALTAELAALTGDPK